jgi:hypothetical protein
MKIYIGNNVKLFELLSKNGFKNYQINKNDKNNIQKLIDFLSEYENPYVIASGINAYYLYYAAEYIRCDSIIINPKFFNGNKLVLPNYNICSHNRNSKKLILISDTNPNLKRIKDFMILNDVKFEISNNITKRLFDEIKKKSENKSKKLRMNRFNNPIVHAQLDTLDPLPFP